MISADGVYLFDRRTREALRQPVMQVEYNPRYSLSSNVSRKVNRILSHSSRISKTVIMGSCQFSVIAKPSQVPPPTGGIIANSQSSFSIVDRPPIVEMDFPLSRN